MMMMMMMMMKKNRGKKQPTSQKCKYCNVYNNCSPMYVILHLSISSQSLPFPPHYYYLEFSILVYIHYDPSSLSLFLLFFYCIIFIIIFLLPQKSLKRHMKKHTGERPHACPYNCGKRFAEKSTLTRHVRIHTGERPYICKFPGCGKSFADRTNVKRHELIHMGQRPYHCKYCDRGFFRPKQVVKHVAKMHPNEEWKDEGREDFLLSGLMGR